MNTLIGIAMLAGQIIAAVKMFGGLKDTPRWLDIATGIALIFMLFAVINLVS